MVAPVRWLLVMLLALGLSPAARASGPVENPGATETERWAWDRLIASEWADFGSREGCSPAPDVMDPGDPAWFDPCRTISARFLETILMREPWRGAIPFRGVRLRGARIAGQLDLRAARVEAELVVEQSRFDETLVLRRARFAGSLLLSRTLFVGEVQANLVRVGGAFAIDDGSHVAGGPLELGGAAIADSVLLQGVFAEGIDAPLMTVQSSLMIAPETIVRNRNADFAAATISGQLAVSKAELTAGLSLGNIVVNGSVFMDGATVIRGAPLDMTGARISGRVVLAGTIIENGLSARGMTVGSVIEFTDAVVRGGIDLLAARIDGHLLLVDSQIEGDIHAPGIRVGTEVVITSTRVSDGAVWLRNATIGGDARFFAARLEGGLDLEGAHITRALLIDDNLIGASRLNLIAARIGTNAYLRGSMLEEGVAANLLDVGGTLFVGPRTRLAEGPLMLNDARIGGRLVLDGARIEGAVGLIGSKVGGDVSIVTGWEMEGGMIGGDLALTDAHVEGSVIVEGTIIGGALGMDAATIGRNLHLAERTTIDGWLRLNDAAIGGSLIIGAIEARAGLAASSATFRRRVEIDRARFADAVDFSDARIDGDVLVREATLGELLLPGATIGGALRLGDAFRDPPRWDERSLLDLRGARIGTIEDKPNAWDSARGWPAAIALQGLRYDRLGDGGETVGDAMHARPASWYAAWLARDAAYSRQPYQHLAGVLGAAGDPERAAAVLTEGRKREMHEAFARGEPLRGIGLFLLWITIGFGIGTGYALLLVWAVVLTGLGAIALRSAPGAAGKGVAWRSAASLDQLLPVISLNREFSDFFNTPDPNRIRLRPWQFWYFTGHRIIGYALGAVLIAALAGLTQAE